MDEQWETEKTGTAGASYYSRGIYDLAIARSIFLESLIENLYCFDLSDRYSLMSDSHLQYEAPRECTVRSVIIDISKYINNYINDSFSDWRDKDSFNSWRTSLQQVTTSLSDHLSEFQDINRLAILSTNDPSDIHMQIWLLTQLNQIIRIGDK